MVSHAELLLHSVRVPRQLKLNRHIRVKNRPTFLLLPCSSWSAMVAPHGMTMSPWGAIPPSHSIIVTTTVGVTHTVTCPYMFSPGQLGDTFIGKANPSHWQRANIRARLFYKHGETHLPHVTPRSTAQAAISTQLFSLTTS
jgi:hypothetical protein